MIYFVQNLWVYFQIIFVQIIAVHHFTAFSNFDLQETDSVPLVKKKTSRKRKLLAHDSKKTKKTKFHKEVNLQMITRSKTKSLSPESNEGSSSPTSMSDSSGELKINESNIEKLPFLGENICEEVLNGLTNWPKSALGWKPIGEAFKLLRISAVSWESIKIYKNWLFFML